MNLELSDEQIFLRDAARDAFSRTNTIEAAREALDGGERPELWPTAVEAGWAGLLVSEERGGAGLGAFDAMLVMQEAGRRLGVEPDRISFVDALRWLQGARPGDELPELVVNPDRPGRVQPRARKRRPKQYPLLKRPRAELRKALLKQRPAA